MNGVKNVSVMLIFIIEEDKCDNKLDNNGKDVTTGNDTVFNFYFVSVLKIGCMPLILISSFSS